jgi:hypothetical protein
VAIDFANKPAAPGARPTINRGAIVEGQRTHDIGPVDPFGFSWFLTVSLPRPPPKSLGLSWIFLDSLVRIETFQRVPASKFLADLLAKTAIIDPYPSFGPTTSHLHFCFLAWLAAPSSS